MLCDTLLLLRHRLARHTKCTSLANTSAGKPLTTPLSIIIPRRLASCLSHFFASCRNSCRIHLVLLDLQMPVLDGWSTAIILRQQHGPSLPILACTAADLASPAHLLAAIPGSCCSSLEDAAVGLLLSSSTPGEAPRPSVQQHALACGADLCLSKPLCMSRLAAALEALDVLPAQAHASTGALHGAGAYPAAPTAGMGQEPPVGAVPAAAPCAQQSSKELPTLGAGPVQLQAVVQE